MARFAILCVLVPLWTAPGADNFPDNPGDDPPGRVARLSEMNGAVSFRAAGTEDWVGAVLNRPLTAGDSIWVDRNGRAELTVGTLAIRLAPESGVDFLNLDDNTVQVRLVQGVINVNVRMLEAGEAVEVDTPSAAVMLVRPGTYRVETNPASGAARVIVRDGAADMISSAEPVAIRSGQQGIADNRDARVQIAQAPPPDGFDVESDRRERPIGRSPSLQHVPRSTVGWEDLDANGDWSEAPEYGPVWTPRVTVANWAPYRYGHWVWIEPWGWTWVDDAPWGFAPFHYGRWVTWRGRWCWVPGPPRVRAVYAPALVVFVGGGSSGLRYHVNVGVEIGIGWFPLGPREVYVPPYRHTTRYVTNINITQTVIRDRGMIGRIDPMKQNYMNYRHPGAVTAVRESAFLSGRGIGRDAVAMSSRDLARARVGGTAAPVAPVRRSVTGDPGVRAPRPPEAAMRRPPVVRQNPAPRQPDFDRRQPELQRNPGVPLDPRRTDEIRRQQPPERPEYRRVPSAQPQRPAEARQPEPRRVEPPRQESPRPETRRGDPRPENNRQQENRRKQIDREHSRGR